MRRSRVLAQAVLTAVLGVLTACAATSPAARAAPSLDDVVGRLRAGGVPCDDLTRTPTAPGLEQATCTTPLGPATDCSASGPSVGPGQEAGRATAPCAARTSLVVLFFPPGPPRTVYTGSYVPYRDAVTVTGAGFEITAPEPLADRVARATGGHRVTLPG